MELLDLTLADGVATITLNDPKRRNAMTLPMCAEIDKAMEILDRALRDGLDQVSRSKDREA